MNDRRNLRVKVRQGLGNLRQVGQHAGGREPRPAPIAQQRGQVGPLDPVHRHHVVLAVEEVLADQRKRRVRRHGEQDPSLAQKLLPRLTIPYRTDLQCDEPAVPLV